MDNDIDLDVDLPEVEATSEDNESVSSASSDDMERLVNEKAEQIANNRLYSLALEDPEFADYLRRKSGIETSGSRKKEVSVSEPDKKSQKSFDISQSLDEIRSENSRQMEQFRWERDQEKFEEFFENDSTIREMPDELVGDLMRNALQGYAIELSNNPKASPKMFLKDFKKVIEGIQNHGVNSYIQKRKNANKIPVSPRDIMSGIRKEKEFKPSPNALKNGEVRTQITKVLKNLGFS